MTRSASSASKWVAIAALLFATAAPGQFIPRDSFMGKSRICLGTCNLTMSDVCKVDADCSKVCSITTATTCNVDGDCPGAETCETQSCIGAAATPQYVTAMADDDVPGVIEPYHQFTALWDAHLTGMAVCAGASGLASDEVVEFTVRLDNVDTVMTCSMDGSEATAPGDCRGSTPYGCTLNVSEPISVPSGAKSSTRIKCLEGCPTAPVCMSLIYFIRR